MEETEKIRAKDLKKGDRFYFMNTMFKVTKVDDDGIEYNPLSQGSGGWKHHFGLKCQQFVLKIVTVPGGPKYDRKGEMMSVE